MNPDSRFLRQTRFAAFGPRGQQALQAARVAVVGVGGLGSSLAEHLCRAGVGQLRLIDRDVVEVSNLPRQALFSEQDAAEGRPKAEAAAAHLQRIGGPTVVEAACEDLGLGNVDRLLSDCDLILDGLDNYAGRYLLGDWCHRQQRPWVHGGAVGSVGSVLRFAATGQPCLRCLFPQPDTDQVLPTCETDGVLSPLPALIASLQACEALHHFADPRAQGRLWQIDPWTGRAHCTAPPPADPDCPCCAHGHYPALNADAPQNTTTLCGQDVIQVHPGEPRSFELAALARGWESLGKVESSPQLARLHVEQLVISVFRDGRALIRGARSAEHARSLYARYVGY